MKATLILTTFNEAGNIKNLFDSIALQSEKLDEIIVVDSESVDATARIAKESLKRLKIAHKVIVRKCDRGMGRNIAVKEAAHDFILGTDAGCVLDKDWVKEMKKAFRENDFVIGNFKATHNSFLEECMSIVMYPAPESNKKLTNASSRSIGFTKQAWEKAGGYPENVGTGEDTEFNFRIKNAKVRIGEAKKAFAYWKVRPTVFKYFKMFYNYGLGDRKNISRIPINFAFSLGFLLYHLAIIALAFINPLAAVILIAFLKIYCFKTGLYVMKKTKKPSGFFFGTWLFYLKRLGYSAGLVLGV